MKFPARTAWAVAFAALLGTALPAQAAYRSWVGALDAADPDSVLLIPFTLVTQADLSVQTWGYGGSARAPGGTNAAGQVIAAGGFDPVLTLFSGQGDTASFLAANDDGLCPPGDDSVACHDATLSLSSLAAGDYTLALSVFGNSSFAENWGGGNLGDGFIGLASWYDVASQGDRSPAYALDLVSDGLGGGSVPEPSTLSLLPAAGLWASRRLRRRLRRLLLPLLAVLALPAWAAGPIKPVYVEAVIPGQPFSARVQMPIKAVHGEAYTDPVWTGPGLGTLGVTSLSFYNPTPWSMTFLVWQPETMSMPGSCDISSFPASPKFNQRLRVMVPALSTQHLTFPSPLVFAARNGSSCIGFMQEGPLAGVAAAPEVTVVGIVN